METNKIQRSENTIVLIDDVLTRAVLYGLNHNAFNLRYTRHIMSVANGKVYPPLQQAYRLFIGNVIGSPRVVSCTMLHTFLRPGILFTSKDSCNNNCLR